MSDDQECTERQDPDLATKNRAFIERSPHGDTRSSELGIKTCILFCFLYALLSLVDAFLYILGDMVIIRTQIPSSTLLIKSGLALPATFLFIAIIQKALGFLTQPRIFEFLLILLALFFLVFGFLIWPYRKSIQMSSFWSRDIFSDGKMREKRLDFFFPIFLIINEWVSTLLYLITDLWGSLVLSLMFFSRVFHQCTENQFKTLIQVLCLGSGIVLLFSGILTRKLNFRWDISSYGDREKMFFHAFLVSSFLTFMAAVTSFLIRKTFQKTKGLHIHNIVPKIGVFESFEVARRSKPLMALACVIGAYSISSNVLETTYRAGIALGAAKLAIPKDSYMNKLNSTTQIIASIFPIVLFFKPATWIIEKLGWLSVASVAPAIMAVSLAIFFPMVLINNSTETKAFHSTDTEIGQGLTNLFVLENHMGMLIVSMIRVSKHYFLDVAKEFIVIKIDPQYRQLFKGVCDGISINAGKTIGSIYCAFATAVFDSRDVRCAAAISLILLSALCILWILSVSYLNKKYNESVERNSFIDIEFHK